MKLRHIITLVVIFIGIVQIPLSIMNKHFGTAIALILLVILNAVVLITVHIDFNRNNTFNYKVTMSLDKDNYIKSINPADLSPTVFTIKNIVISITIGLIFGLLLTLIPFRPQ